MRQVLSVAGLAAAALMLQACVSAAIGATGSAVGAGVEVTGKTAGAAKDVVFLAPSDAQP